MIYAIMIYAMRCGNFPCGNDTVAKLQRGFPAPEERLETAMQVKE